MELSSKKIPSEVTALKIFIGEGHYTAGVPVYETLLYRAREMGLAGATVYKTDIGYGQKELDVSAESHKYKVSDDVPVVIEIIDDIARLKPFIAVAREIVGARGLMITYPVHVIHYGTISYQPAS